jgi:ParB/Sulfiredoxin domain
VRFGENGGAGGHAGAVATSAPADRPGGAPVKAGFGMDAPEAGRDHAHPWPADKVERRPVAALVPSARNARTHSDAQVDQIAASIQQWGWTIPVLVDEADVLIAGHGRVLAAGKLGLDTVPVMTARGWTEEQKAAYRLADNKLSLNAGWDEELLTGELIGISPDLRALVGFNTDELRALSIGVNETDFPDIPANERSEFRLMNFTLHKDQLATIEAAMEAAKAQGPFDGPNPNKNGNALARICSGYLEWAQRTSE